MAMHVKFPFGKLVSVLVTHVEASTGDFFVQINDEAGKLDTLMVEIEQNVLSGRAKPPTASEMMVGRIYVVQYQEDSRWYRARVLGVNVAEQQCEVFFIDYGNTEFVSLSCIRNAEEKFCELPPQCFECELEGFDRFRGDRFDEMLTLLNDTILEQELYCKAIHLKKNCVLVAQLFVDDKGTQSVLDVMQNGGAGTTEDALTNGDVTMARQPSLKREAKYKVVTLPQDSFHDLSVTWVEDPSHFWCQLLSNAETLEQLMERIADVYANLDPSVLPLQSCTVGYPCCAKFYEDDAWYRGIITNVSSIVTGQIEVRFVDYGNTQNTALSDVRDLKDEYLKEPCQALYFAIAGVDPASKDGLWADEAKALFEKLINYKHVVGLVTSVESDGRHRVKLMDTTSDLDMELNQILIAANYGVKSADSTTSRTFTVPTTAFKPSDAASKPAPRPVFSKEKIQIGVEEKVLVTNIITPGKFYCQLFRNGPRLENLMMEVARYYTKLGANEELLSSPSPGDPCCAQFSEDNCWYRAVVLSTAPKGITVLYIDYGNSETVPVSRIKKLIPKFSELPQQGIECTLNRIKPRFTRGAGESKWKSGDSQKFMDLALEMEGKMTVIAQDGNGICRVELVVRNRREEQNISEQLLIGGNAELADGALSASANFSNLKSQTFPEPDLEVGQFEDVIVSYIDHPCDFWCQLRKTAEQLDSLMHEISALYSSGGQRNSISNPACGMLCCAQFTEDGKWYRGKITGVQKGGQVEVHFVDYGNYELLPLSRVKKLQAEYLLLPPQAVKCALLKIDPLNKDLLSHDLMHRFEELTLDKELVMMADKYDKSSGTYEVVLLDTTEGRNLDVAKELQALLGPSTNQGAASIVGVVIQPGVTEQVFVSSATSPSKFSCQLMKTASSLDDLMNEMFDYYEQLGPQQEQMPKPSVGEFCAAKFTLDDGWYRGKVLDVQGDSISVLYIDYGNSETLSLSRLKALNSKFHSLPSQAIDCTLSGNLRGINNTQFQEIVSEKEFTAKVLSVKSGVAALDLVSKETSQSVANMLGRESKSSASSACSIAYSDWKIGDTLDVYVPFVESAQKFFCQASSHSSKLDDLMNKLDKHYNSNSENLTTILNGSCCIAMYSDGGWYRAKVEHVQGGEIKVNYIDYGDSAIVPVSSIRALMPEFSNLPAQAVQCCLKGFVLRTGPENFKDLVLEQEFKAQVVSAKSSGIYEVDLIPQDGSASISQVLSKDFETGSLSSLSVPSIQWKLGDNVSVFVSFVESTQKFFCQVSEYASGLDDLMTKLEMHYGASQENVASVTAGMFCLAQYVDGGWYRAQVLHVQDKSVNVFYIDYGDTATLPLRSLRSLIPEFSSLPAQAVKCCLKGHSTNQGPKNFKDLVIEQEFQAQVISVKGQDTYEVDLVSNNYPTSISNKLLEGAETAEVSSCSIPSIQWKQGDQVEVFVPFVESEQNFFCQSSRSSSDLDDLMTRLEEFYTTNQEPLTSISSGSFCVAQYEDGGWYRAQVTQVQGQSISVFYIDYGDTATLPMSSIRALRPEFSSLPAQAVKCCLKEHSTIRGPENFKDLVIEQEFQVQVISVKGQDIYEVDLFPKNVFTSISNKLSRGTETAEVSSCSVPSIQWKQGDQVEVYVAFVESAQKFFCQSSRSSSDLDDVMTKLEEYYTTNQEDVTSISTGAFCVAQYEDGGWYRAQVTQVQGQSISVFYIDYGDSATLPLSGIRSIMPAFCSLPAQAVHCCLNGTPQNFKDVVLEQEFVLHVVSNKQPGIYEVELTSKDGSVLFGDAPPSEIKTDTSLLDEITEGSSIQFCPTACISPHLFHCQIATADHKERLEQLMNQLQDCYEVLGVQEQGISNPTVGTNCAAVFADDGLWYRGTIVEVVDQQMVKVSFSDFGNIDTVPLNKLKTISVDLLQLPPQVIQCGISSISPVAGAEWSDDSIERFSNLTMHKRLHGKVIKKESGNLEIELFDTSDSSEDINIGELLVKEGLAKTSSVMKSLSDLEKPCVSKNEKVYITAVESPESFYCQISGSEEKLISLMGKISAIYDSMPADELKINAISVGDVCCAQFSEDNQWYRAVVEGVSASELTVRFIDYGNLETLNIDRTKVLNDDFFSDPPLAIKCCLHNLQPSGGQTWADEAGTFLEGLVSELDAQFLSFTEPFKIQLRDGATDVQEELVKAGLAVIKSTVPGTTTGAEYIKPILKSGETCDVCISYMSSPGEFYCQLANLQEQLDGMMNDLNSHYSQLSETESSIDSPVVGQSCVALYEGMWYRANIVSLSENDFTVHYVDYGNEETLEHSAIKQISPLFLKTPQVAVKCSLDPNRDQWSEKATALFEDLTGEDELVIKIIGQKGDTYHVKVFSKDEHCVSEDVYNTFSGEVQDLQQQKPVFPEVALHSGLTEDIYVSYVKSSQAFYIQLSKTYDRLLQMMAELSRVNSCLPDEVHPPDLVVGTPICALFAEDEKWYRAVIESIPSEFEVGVHFVDYGNSDVVLLSDVRPLDKKFLNLPMQAVHCCLDSQVDADTFRQQVDGRELKATFVSLKETTQWQVSLSDKGGKLIGAKTKPKVLHPYIDEGPMLEDNSDTCHIMEFTQLKIKPNVTNTVYVSHVVTPDEFYVQFESTLHSLSILSEKMSIFYSKIQPSDFLLNNPCTGMSCCARFSEDGNWYRGKIREVGSHGALVQFIDYGNCEVVPFYNIKDADKEFMQLPQQSTLCGLDATKDVWSPEEVNTLKTVALDKCFQAKFIIRDGPKWRVCLENNGVSVLDVFMGKVTEESSIQVGTYSPQKLFSSQVEEVFVSYVTESGDFFVQLSKTSPDLQTIEMLVSETYNQMGPTEDALEMCFVDSPCCAKFSQDFKWYRALVTRIFSEAEVEVLFVDYGNTDTLKVEGVKQIKSELLTFPVQAVKCRLEGSKEVWTDSDVQQFKASVMDKPLHVTFTRQQGDTWFVTIQELDLFTSKVTPKVKSFSREVFDCNNQEDAYFVCADSPDCIWLQPARTGDALIALMDQIANDVTGQQMDKSHLLPRVPCLGQFTDNDVWHRAQILNVQGNSSVTVFYVDYGNSETLTMDRLHPISDSHLKLPAQAIHCRLADLEGVDPTKVTEYLNEVLCEKLFKVEVQERHADGSYTVKLYEVGSELSVNEQVVGECLGDTSLIEEATLEQLTPPHPSAPGEKRSFKLPEVKKGTILPVSFVSAFLPSKIQLLLSERIEERDKITNHVTSMFEALGADELKLENPEVGVLCCVHFSPGQGEASKWYRGEVISISADDTATVKLVDYGTHEKIPISELRFLKDELLEMPVFILEGSLAGVRPRSHDGQWSPECSSVLESFCRSKVLTANITEVYRDLVELILTSDDGKVVNESLVDLGYAEVCNIQEDFSLEEQQIKWPELEVGQCLDVFMMAIRDLQSIQLQLADSEAELTKMREQLTAVYSLLGEAEEVIGNPRVGQVCCAQFADDKEWYRAVITCVSDTGIEVKFLDYGNMDVALSTKQLKEDFLILPVQCFECSLSGIIPAPEYSDTETATKLLEMCDGNHLTAEITFVSGDSVMVNLFHDSGETKQSVADSLVNLGYAVPQPKSRDEPRRISVSDEGKIVYNYPNYGEVHTVCLISVTSPSDFWCQLENFKTELKSMSEKIELFYDSLGENDLRLHFLQDGDVCCAKFAEDDKWYRSLVDKVCSDGQVIVRSVDHSKQETLTLDRIKKLEAAFAVLPVQAVNCSLSSIEPPHKYYGEEWSSEAVEHFKELGQGKELKIKVKGQEGSIVLVELLNSAGLSVADQLLSEQLAVERKLPLNVSPLKGIEKQLKSLSTNQVVKALRQSSEEHVFHEAESGVEGVQELSEEKESNEEEEGEFHDSSDQFTSEEKSETSAALENEEGGLQTAGSSVEEKDATPLGETEVQGSVNLQSSDERPAESLVEVIEEKPAITADEVRESNAKKEAKSKAEIVLGEQKEAETEAQSSEKIKFSEQVDSMANEDAQSVILFAREGSEKADDKGEKELKVDKANEIAASQEEEEVGNTRDTGLSETTKVEQIETNSEEEHLTCAVSVDQSKEDVGKTSNLDTCETTIAEPQETKTEQEHVTSSVSEKQSVEEVGETSNTDICGSSVAEREETKTEQEHVTSSASEKQGEEEVGVKSNLDICESFVAEHEETKTEQECVTSFASEKQSEEEVGKSSNIGVCESSIGEQVETGIQQEHISAAAPEEQSKGEVGRASNKDICKTTIAEQVETNTEQEHVTCEDSKEQSEEEVGNSSSIDTCETTEAEGLETKIKQELVSAAVSDEQDGKEYHGEGETDSSETTLGQAKVAVEGPVSLEEKGDGLGTVLDGSSGAKEKEDELMVKGSVNNNDASISEDIVDGEGKATCSMGGPNNSVTEEQEGLMEDKHSSADITEQKEDCEKFAEDQEGVNETFSEEDLTAITGSAEDGTEATEENKSDGERPQQSNLQETNKQTSVEEETARVFLDEILSEVCGDDEKPQREQSEQLGKEEGAQNTATANEEKPAVKLGSEAELCVDVDDTVLSDEALEKLDKELEKAEGNKPEVSCSGAAITVNGIDRE